VTAAPAAPLADVAPTGGSGAATDADYARAILNILEDFHAQHAAQDSFQKAILNVLDDSSAEAARLVGLQRAVVNILEDAAGERDRLEAAQRAVLNILEDAGGERERLEATQRAVLNILDDAAVERDRLESMQRAVLNILDDASGERDRLESTQRAVLNILDDAGGERERLESTQRAVLNILDDAGAEKIRLRQVQSAILNILDDFEQEKHRTEDANRGLRREIAERVAAQQALQSSNADLEQFAYVASHDLQEPLRMVSSYMELFARRYAGHVDEQADRYIRYAVDGARRMQALINALLEYSRVGRRGAPAHTVRADDVLDQALENLRPALEQAGALVEREPLPSVSADEAQLVQVFQNLVGNAVKFQPKEARPVVRVRAAPDGARWRFSIADNGIGIAQAHLDRIFVIFQRLHTRAEYPGTGIGLSICRKVVERHGGRIWAESEPGRGTTFHFTLPAAETGDAAATAATAEAP